MGAVALRGAPRRRLVQVAQHEQVIALAVLVCGLGALSSCG